ncbi:hypothetical protein R3P38DRAFT_948617 [Favolaschia claudopus]|uniref:Uncharacterized protein n=1 Tax=Favolaschia claudopus TaxID=2862362 RepID=A0AAW0BM72_9AGAR
MREVRTASCSCWARNVNILQVHTSTPLHAYESLCRRAADPDACAVKTTWTEEEIYDNETWCVYYFSSWAGGLSMAWLGSPVLAILKIYYTSTPLQVRSIHARRLVDVCWALPPHAEAGIPCLATSTSSGAWIRRPDNQLCKAATRGDVCSYVPSAFAPARRTSAGSGLASPSPAPPAAGVSRSFLDTFSLLHRRLAWCHMAPSPQFRQLPYQPLHVFETRHVMLTTFMSCAKQSPPL